MLGSINSYFLDNAFCFVKPSQMTTPLFKMDFQVAAIRHTPL